MFTFPRIGSLTEEEAAEALQMPATSAGVRWADDALSAALEVTGCYPYFLQEFGLHAWDVADGPHAITGDDFNRSVPLSIATLDDNFFRVRAGSSTPSERAYMRAMARLGPGPVRTADVAAQLGRPLSAVSSVREGLIRRALCFAPGRGQIAFTVPLFDQYLKRWLPDS
jgi:hypothetical protein